jgi:hypothetical protein
LPVQALAAAPAREPGPSPPGDPIADAIKQERFDQLRRANRREAEEEAARSGKYTDAAEAARQMGVMATKMMAVIEGSLAELASAVSARFEIPQRDVLHLLRSEFRKVRAAAAKNIPRYGDRLTVVSRPDVPCRCRPDTFRQQEQHSSSLSPLHRRGEPTDQSFFELAASLANRSAFSRSKFLRSAICSFSYSVSGPSDGRNMLLASFSRLLMT